MKYIDADLLRKAVEKKYNSNDTVGDRWDLGYDTACEQILDIIESLQQEQPEVDLEKVDLTEEINRYCGTKDVRPVSDFMETVAYHFYELGQQNKYQKDRAEFAKLKAKEWLDGYDNGYQRGLNARKEK